MLLQNADGNKPGGFVAEEWQEWFISRAAPAMQRAMEQILAADPELAAEHDALQKRLNWDEAERGGKLFLVGYDHAPVHTWTDFPHQRATRGRGTRSRLDLKKGQRGWVQFKRCQCIPSTAKVPDCIQEPVEMVLGCGKRSAAKANRHEPGTAPLTWQQMCANIAAGLQADRVLGMARGCWDKAIQACRVFSGKRGKWVTADARGKKRRVLCVDGGPVPKVLRG